MSLSLRGRSDISSPPENTTRSGTGAGLSLAALTAIVVGSMIGSGIFALPSQMAGSAAPGPLLIGWLVTGSFQAADGVRSSSTTPSTR